MGLSDAAVDDGSSASRSDGASLDDASGPSEVSDAGTAEPPDASAGPCDLSGSWLITQHGIYQALGVRQSSQTWLYYEMEQTGDTLRVTRGLSCGGRSMPKDLIGAGVEFEAAFAALTAKNSHTGRLAKVTSNGAGCSVSFERAFTVVGATVAYYNDASRDLPTLDQPAAGDQPGWEDWDNDGNPGVSFIISGLARGARYSAQRIYHTWPSGSYAPGATALRVVSVTQSDESLLGATSDIIKSLSVPDGDPSTGFADFAKLDATQTQGDDETKCATARALAPTLTPEANNQ